MIILWQYWPHHQVIPDPEIKENKAMILVNIKNKKESFTATSRMRIATTT